MLLPMAYTHPTAPAQFTSAGAHLVSCKGWSPGELHLHLSPTKDGSSISASSVQPLRARLSMISSPRAELSAAAHISSSSRRELNQRRSRTRLSPSCRLCREPGVTKTGWSAKNIIEQKLPAKLTSPRHWKRGHTFPPAILHWGCPVLLFCAKELGWTSRSTLFTTGRRSTALSFRGGWPQSEQ